MSSMYLCFTFLLISQASYVLSGFFDFDTLFYLPRGYVNVKFDCGNGVFRSYQKRWYGSEESKAPVLQSTECFSVLLRSEILRIKEITKMDTFVIEWSNEFWLSDNGWSWRGDSGFTCIGKCDSISYSLRKGETFIWYGKNESEVHANYGKEYIMRNNNETYSTLILSRPRDTAMHTCRIESQINVIDSSNQ